MFKCLQRKCLNVCIYLVPTDEHAHAAGKLKQWLRSGEKKKSFFRDREVSRRTDHIANSC